MAEKRPKARRRRCENCKRVNVTERYRWYVDGALLRETGARCWLCFRIDIETAAIAGNMRITYENGDPAWPRDDADRAAGARWVASLTGGDDA